MKRYNILKQVGKAKYVVSYHDGIKKHSDGSDFYDIAIFKSIKKMNPFILDLYNKGYMEE
jgi:hypothetical protein